VLRIDEELDVQRLRRGIVALVEHSDARHQTAETATVSAQRLMDLALAIAGLVVLTPLMMLIALAICIETGRPIFYSQTRIGRAGRRFRIHKFRKFQRDIGDGCPLTVEHDPRMTPIGRVLALTKLDELPQLWNVVVGEMSIVGPRPESLDFFDCFTGPYLKVLDHTPGIFGPSQVAFRDERSLYPANSDPIQFYRDVLFPMKARIDLSYFSHRTISSDIRWIVCGVLAVAGHRLLPAKWWLQRMPANWVSASQLSAAPAPQGRK
jgi:lipopolysaccharide/colanic/teichoic acid biosynthesis glycosyltransferase